MYCPLQTIQTYSMLERFWARYNKVAIERQALLARRNMYAKDNHNLRLSLRNYMGGLNPPALDVIQFSNELVVTPNPSIPSSPNYSTQRHIPTLNSNLVRMFERTPTTIPNLPVSSSSKSRTKSSFPPLTRRSTRNVIEGVNVMRSLQKYNSNRPSLGFPILFNKS